LGERASRSFKDEQMSAWIEVLGRSHPMLLHAPIGIFIGLAAIELAMVLARGSGWLGAVRVLATIGALSAVAAGVTGYILSQEGGGQTYAGKTLDLHFYTGIACTILACLTAAVSLWGDKPLARRALLLATLAMLFPAGHLGATMTHGADFLFAPLNRKADREPNAEFEPTITPVATTRFAAEIKPILARTCYACHGEEKAKGGLRMHTQADLLAGGDLGSLFVAGNPEASQIVDRIQLPLLDDDHMPPEGKPQPTEAEIAAIVDWVKRGARFDEPLAGEAPPPPAPTLAPAAPAIPPPSASAVSALRAALAHAEPVSESNPRLIVSFAAIAPTIDDAKAEALLKPLADSIEDLSLARTQVGAKTMALVATMPHLRRLDVASTPITVEQLVMLKGHGALEELILARTKLAGADGAVRGLLTSLPKIRTLYVWDAGLTPETIADLRELKTGLSVDAGDKLTTTTLEGETDLKFTSDAPPVGATPAVAADLKPINTVCPISGSPIKPEYQILYKGKVIGFCCPNCPKTFWEDPEKHLANLK
jgi:uncharacterized membrane protein/YHS domain-containing protein